MSIVVQPFSLQIPTQIGPLSVVFFVNENLHVSNRDCVSAPHNHHDYELRYIEAGTCKQIVEAQTFTVSAGDFLLVQPFEYHCQDNFNAEEKSSQFNLRFSLRMHPATNENSEQERVFRKALQLISETRSVHDGTGIMLTYLQQLAAEISQKRDGYIFGLQSLCSLILIEIFRLTNQSKAQIFPVEDIKYPGRERAKIEFFFRKNCFTNLSVKDLAEEMKTSPRQINRIIHKLFDCSFTEKLTEMRLQEVAHRIVATDRSIVSVAHDCGFKNYNYCFKCFKQKFGMSPKEYRALNRKKEAIPMDRRQNSPDKA